MHARELLKKYSNQINRLDIELLLSHVVNKPREFIISHPEQKLTKLQSYKFKKLINKRGAGVPLAYLTGHKEFYGLDFFVNKHTLIPRPDTEIMIDLVVNKIKDQRVKESNDLILIDIGTGSGCISIATLSALQHFSTSAPITYATDISKKALKIAEKNATKHSVNIKFLHGNLLEPAFQHINTSTHQHIIITANLPYLTEEQFKLESSIQHEPKSALVAKDNGLALYEELLIQIAQLSAFCFILSTFIEIDPLQSDPITHLINKYLPTAKIEIKKDLVGHNRIVEILNEFPHTS